MTTGDTEGTREDLDQNVFKPTNSLKFWRKKIFLLKQNVIRRFHFLRGAFLAFSGSLVIQSCLGTGASDSLLRNPNIIIDSAQTFSF